MRSPRELTDQMVVQQPVDIQTVEMPSLLCEHPRQPQAVRPEQTRTQMGCLLQKPHYLTAHI